MALKAPFPYFGGKSAVAGEVWQRLGNPKTYVEPFFGSGAVLLNRPGKEFGREIVNDYDGHLCNVWRSIQFNPDEVARWCDWPTNHIDLMARRQVLMREAEGLRQKLITDPDYYNAKLAGYWVWCTSNWIGSGMLNGKPAECQVPHLTSNQGVMCGGVRDWLCSLRDRLRNVKVVCGDWTRVMGGNWRTKEDDCGVFLDPPYGDKANRHKGVYANDDLSVAEKVLQWCKENGDNQRYRIALCGYAGEHDDLGGLGWDVYEWKTAGGYGNQGDSQGKVNKTRERIWFSPHCVKADWFALH